MQLNEYQELSARTASNKLEPDQVLINWALGLAGEVGEYVELIKKRQFHGKAIDQDAVRKELGDILWYLAQSASEWGFTLDEIANANLEKLAQRYPDGFGKRADE